MKIGKNPFCIFTKKTKNEIYDFQNMGNLN